MHLRALPSQDFLLGSLLLYKDPIPLITRLLIPYLKLKNPLNFHFLPFFQIWITSTMFSCEFLQFYYLKPFQETHLKLHSLLPHREITQNNPKPATLLVYA